jgi:hypothetical protein
MLQRRRRPTRFQVEMLEGRAVPSIIATSAVINAADKRFAYIYGHTTSPTRVGETLEIRATEHLAHSSITIVAHREIARVESTSVAGHTGVFSAYVETSHRDRHFTTDGTFTVVAINVTNLFNPHEVERTTTRDVPVSQD